jgi:hypothetical protein
MSRVFEESVSSAVARMSTMARRVSSLPVRAPISESP